MLFVCRNCGNTSEDIDMVLDGSCKCGGSHFKLVSDDSPKLPTVVTPKEEMRNALHLWIDLNIDSMEPEQIGDIRVRFESSIE